MSELEKRYFKRTVAATRSSAECTLSWKALVYGSIASVGIGLCQEARSATAPVTSPWPLPLELRVPFEPTAFPSADRTYLTYELYLTNFGAAQLPPDTATRRLLSACSRRRDEVPRSRRLP